MSGSATAGGVSSSRNDAGGAGEDGGAGGTPPTIKSCGDYDDLPADCACHDYGGRAYLFCSTMRSWSQSSSRCGFDDMALVKIESPSEDEWVVKTAKAITDPRPLTYFWIGASSRDSPGTWHWPDGSVFWQGNASGSAVGDSYANWRVSSPQNTSGAACIFSDDYGWEEGDCAINRGYVCESQ